MPRGRTRRSGGVRVRPAVPGDGVLLGRHRVGMFRDMGRLPAGDPREAAVVRATAAFARRALRSGELVAWVVEADGAPVGSGAVLVRNLMPSPAEPRVRREAYLLNVYTEPAARRRGVASAVVRAALDWCRREKVARAALHASDAGRGVYERLGFVAPRNVLEWRPGPPVGAAKGPRRPRAVVPSRGPGPGR